jgi:chromosomal replication initiator protein
MEASLPAEPAAAPSPPELDELWGRVQETLRGSIRREQFETWFRRAALVALDDSVATVAVHNGFTRDWLARYYREVLSDSLEREVGSKRRIEFKVDPERTRRLELRPTAPPPPAPPPVPRIPTAKASAAAAVIETEGSLLITPDVGQNPTYRFDGFVVGPCNRFAHAASVGVAENPGRAYNPLFLHGSVGLGKTHLLQSLCHAILERNPATRILYLSCETFVNHFISALENGDLAKFRTKYRNVDLLVVDDIHLLANKERTQEEFFHTFNSLYNAGKQIVLSSDSPPLEIPTLQERLVSRFKWGLVTEIEEPCYETRVAILKRKSRERGRELSDEVARFLAEKIDTNVRELEGAVTKILCYAGLSGQEISLQLVRQCLRELFSSRSRQASIEDILGVVTERFGVKLADLQSRKRTNAVAYPRQVGMYLARRITNLSLEEIGGYFGGRDHSTVLYGIEKITALCQEDPACRSLLAELTLELQGPL